MSSFGAGAKPRRDSARTNRADNDESQQPDPSSGPKGVHTMRSRSLRGTGIASVTVGLILTAGLLAQPPRAQAKQEIRDAFFLLYPNALGTTIDTVPSHPDHCGVCHFRFRGGGTRNPYGLRVEDVIGDFPNTEQGRMDAIESVELEDPDGDGYTSLTEITDTLNFANTPTFPGLTPANVGNVTDVDIADIQRRARADHAARFRHARQPAVRSGHPQPPRRARPATAATTRRSSRTSTGRAA
jgi:hypothetical protein